jgi:hypothetical protein
LHTDVSHRCEFRSNTTEHNQQRDITRIQVESTTRNDPFTQVENDKSLRSSPFLNQLRILSGTQELAIRNTKRSLASGGNPPSHNKNRPGILSLKTKLEHTSREQMDTSSHLNTKTISIGRKSSYSQQKISWEYTRMFKGSHLTQRTISIGRKLCFQMHQTRNHISCQTHFSLCHVLAT